MSTQRIFDHLDGVPEDQRFSRVARNMRSSPWWSAVPARDEPDAISGEVLAREVGAGKDGASGS